MLNGEYGNDGGLINFEKMEIFKGLNEDSADNQVLNETLKQVIEDLK